MIIGSTSAYAEDCSNLGKRLGHLDGATSVTNRYKKLSGTEALCLTFLITTSREQNAADHDTLSECYKTDIAIRDVYFDSYKSAVNEQIEQIKNPCSVLTK